MKRRYEPTSAPVNVRIDRLAELAGRLERAAKEPCAGAFELGSSSPMTQAHTIAAGECLSSIAKRYGFPKWQTLYDHPDNADLKKKRPNPNLVHPGDVVMIPERDGREVECATGALHTFKLAQPKAKLRVVLKNAKGEPFGDKKYVLHVGDQELEGRAGAAGLVEKQVDAAHHEAFLTLFVDDTSTFKWRLRIGHLDPTDADSGVHSRLKNLGYSPGPAGQRGRRFEGALRRFQRHHGLEVTGELDDPTRQKLNDLHDQK